GGPPGCEGGARLMDDAELTDLRHFVESEVGPRAEEMDRSESFSPQLHRRLAEEGYFGWWAPAGGGGRAVRSSGRLHAEVGRFCSSTRAVLCVHQMCATALARWGSGGLRRQW